MVPQTLTYLLSAAIAATALPNAHNATAHPTVTLHPTSPHTPKTVFVGRALPEFNQDLFLGIKYADKPARFTPSAVKSVYAANDSNAGPYTGRVPGVGHSAVLYDATAYGNECPGYGSDETKLVNSGTIRLDEDCLNLNVIRPRTDDGALLPVMLWIFGGGWQQGATADPRYNMSYVVRQGELSGNPVLGVSINYRVAAFGFLDSEEVRAAGVNNLGLRDQRVAMRWVKDNIRAFGGDPDKVTIWGESAGAYSVGAHLVANGGDHEGLFRAAIMESGNAVGPPWNGTDWHQPMYDRIVNKTGCTSSANTLECLRNTPYELFYASANEGLEWFGAIDGAFIREYPQISMTAGRIAAVPILLGSNTDEGTSLGTTGTNTDEECIAQLICTLPSSHPSSAALTHRSIETLGAHPRPGHQAPQLLPQRPGGRLPLRLGQRHLAESRGHVQTLRVDGRRSDHGRAAAAAGRDDGAPAAAGVFVPVGRGGAEHLEYDWGRAFCRDPVCVCESGAGYYPAGRRSGAAGAGRDGGADVDVVCGAFRSESACCIADPDVAGVCGAAGESGVSAAAECELCGGGYGSGGGHGVYQQSGAVGWLVGVGYRTRLRATTEAKDSVRSIERLILSKLDLVRIRLVDLEQLHLTRIVVSTA